MQQSLKVRLEAIETGCAKELLLRLRTLRDQIIQASHTLGSTHRSSSALSSVQNSARSVSQSETVEQLSQ